MKDDRVLEALLDLNAALMMGGYESDYTIQLSDRDFDKFVTDWESKHRASLIYPDLPKRLKDLKEVKLAGPGCYFLLQRKS